MSSRKKILNIFINITIGFVLIGFAVSLYIWQPSILRQVDNKIYDVFLIRAPKSEISSHVAVIDIDEKSLAEVGQWPWPRYLLAEVIATLTNSGVAAIGLDMLIFEPDRTSAYIIASELELYFGINVTMEGLPEILEDHDKLLSETIAQCPVVLAMFMDYGMNTPNESPNGLSGELSNKLPNELPAELPSIRTVSMVQLAGADAPLPMESIMPANAIRPPLPVLIPSADIGAVNIAPDQDGILRRIPLVVRAQDTLYPSLVLQTLAVAIGKKQVLLYSDLNGLYEVKIGTYRIPVSSAGEMAVMYKGPSKTYPFYSASDVLNGRVKPEDLAGKIVFIGSSAAALTDIRATPYDSVYPGVEVHAAALDTILSADFIVIPAWTHAAQFLAIILYGIAGSIIFGALRAQFSLLLGVASLAFTFYASYWAFTSGIYVSPLYVSIILLLQGLILTFWRFWREETQKRHLRQVFGRYVSPEIVSRIVEQEDDLLNGEEREVTIMFTDLRGFTSLSEKLKPETAVQLLNDYFTPMTALIRNSKGTLDKFIGDAIMAFWNAPLDVLQHTVHGVGAAMEMQETLYILNATLQEKYGVQLEMGVGLHVGTVYVGNMGSHDLLDYTIIGDNVNLASRLEGLCPKYGVPIVVSGQVKELCGDAFAFIPVDVLRVKGKETAVEIYTPLKKEKAEKRRQELEEYSLAHGLYLEQKFDEAEKAFERLEEIYGQGLYKTYRKRCESLKSDSFPEDWDGIWTFDSK